MTHVSNDYMKHILFCCIDTSICSPWKVFHF